MGDLENKVLGAIRYSCTIDDRSVGIGELSQAFDEPTGLIRETCEYLIQSGDLIKRMDGKYETIEAKEFDLTKEKVLYTSKTIWTMFEQPIGVVTFDHMGDPDKVQEMLDSLVEEGELEEVERGYIPL